eukprot:scaffold109358_cov22-Prasinocladus_malaysianus.AAC.1
MACYDPAHAYPTVPARQFRHFLHIYTPLFTWIAPIELHNLILPLIDMLCDHIADNMMLAWLIVTSRAAKSGGDPRIPAI